MVIARELDSFEITWHNMHYQPGKWQGRCELSQLCYHQRMPHTPHIPWHEVLHAPSLLHIHCCFIQPKKVYNGGKKRFKSHSKNKNVIIENIQ